MRPETHRFDQRYLRALTGLSDHEWDLVAASGEWLRRNVVPGDAVVSISPGPGLPDFVGIVRCAGVEARGLLRAVVDPAGSRRRPCVAAIAHHGFVVPLTAVFAPAVPRGERLAS